jgi:hypothetical protein
LATPPFWFANAMTFATVRPKLPYRMLSAECLTSNVDDGKLGESPPEAVFDVKHSASRKKILLYNR